MPASDFDNMLEWSELDEAASRHDRTRAAPDKNGLQVMWNVYWPLLLIFSVVIIIVFFGIISHKKARKNPFNKYVIFLSFPDFLYSFLCAITCFLSAHKGRYTSWEMCQFQVFYLQFGGSANAWLNGLLAYEIHKLLKSSQIRKKYYPPTDRQVYISATICYALAFVAGALPLLGTRLDWMPEPGLQSGFVCTSSEQTVAHSLVFWFIISPILFGLPYLYAAYVFYDVIVHSRILPPKGRRRDLAIYFFRIGTVFLFLWMPTIAIMYVFRGIASPWLVWGLGLFSHTQGLVSALMAMLKDDIRYAVLEFVLWPWGYKAPLDPISGRRKSQAASTGVSQLSVQRVDEFGLPMQGTDFQFLDETSTSISDGPAPFSGGPANLSKRHHEMNISPERPLAAPGCEGVSNQDKGEDSIELGLRIQKWADR